MKYGIVVLIVWLSGCAQQPVVLATPETVCGIPLAISLWAQTHCGYR